MSEQHTPPSVVGLVMTGYGPFLDVLVNPSDSIMKTVAATLAQQQVSSTGASGPKFLLLAQHVLDVNVQAVARYMSEAGSVVETAAAAATTASDSVDCTAVLCCHFGVNRSAVDTIAVECVGKNCVVLPARDANSGFSGAVCCPIVSSDSSRKKSEDAAATAATNNDDDDEEGNNANESKVRKVAADFADGDSGSSSSSTTVSASSSSSPASTAGKCPALISPITNLVHEICSSLPLLIEEAEDHKDEGQNEDEKAAQEDDASTGASSKNKKKTRKCVARMQPSADAGSYLCNYLLHQSLLRWGGGKKCFVDFPSEDVARGWKEAESKPMLGDGQTDSDRVASAATRRRPVYSLFIHVLDPIRMSIETQAAGIVEFLRRLADKL